MWKRFHDIITILSVKYEPLKVQVIGCKSDRHRIVLVLYPCMRPWKNDGGKSKVKLSNMLVKKHKKQTLGEIYVLLKKLLEAVEVNSTTWLKTSYTITTPTLMNNKNLFRFQKLLCETLCEKKCAPPYFVGIEWKLHSRKYKYLQNIMDELLQNNNTVRENLLWKHWM